MNREKLFWLYDILFLLILVVAGYLRLTGANWGEAAGQHPDENTFSGVLGNLRAHKCADETIPIDACPAEQQRWLGIGDYFDSKTSTLNPYNRGYGSYVYGDLPMIAIRVVAEATNQPDLRLFGRQASAFADLLAIIFLYFAVTRLYNRRIALLAALFSAFTVMQIQQSHFFTTDLFVNTFAMLAILFAVEIMKDKSPDEQRIETSNLTSFHSLFTTLYSLFSTRVFRLSIYFGIAYSMALASKVNIFPLAILLPGAFILRHMSPLSQRERAEGEGESSSTDIESLETDSTNIITPSPDTDLSPTTTSPVSSIHSLFTANYSLILLCLLAGGFAALIGFRIFQPYAFDGIGLDERWTADIQQQRLQATGEADLPWNLQWARRSNLYSFTNLTVWGLGLPLGILAWIGFLVMGWRILKGEYQHLLLWGWTAAYFGWQSLQFNPTMRYQLPIYPLLIMMAAWLALEKLPIPNYKLRTSFSILRTVTTIIVITLTAAWAFAFHTIYTRDESRIAASRWIFQNVAGPINIHIENKDGTTNQPLPFPYDASLQAGQTYDKTFIAQADGLLTSISFGHATNPLASTSTIKLTLSDQPDPTPEHSLATSSITSDFASKQDQRGETYTFEFEEPIQVTAGTQYYLRFELDQGTLVLSGDTVANETSFDYGLPMRVDGYDAYGGIYRGDLNLEVYWDDNPDKLTRYINLLDQTDYILIPTNHQYAQISRVPERYPLTAYYYRELMGCPPALETIPCYHEAQPGDYEGRLGYDLVAVFERFPTLGGFSINDQYAEEAFTFYDHPKVFIFKKNADYSSQALQESLSRVDLTKVVRLTPRQFDDYSDLMLPDDRLASQRAGGTWSELFDYDWVQNKYPWVGLVVWYLFIAVLGLAVYPLIRLAMPGLADKGYPLSRALGLVLLGYLSWLAGSTHVIPYTRTTIAIVFGVIVLIGIGLARYQHEELRAEWENKRKYFVLIEATFLIFFLFDLLIRIGNPDLWHVNFGGERPMDFSYLNAVIKSTSFPPYDPWFAGGHINYYYYGFVLIGTPMKLLGIVPAIAYNFALPTLFAIVAICAFSIGWNFLAKYQDAFSVRSIAKYPEGTQDAVPDSSSFTLHPASLIAAFSASILTLFLGNLGTLQAVYNKMQQLGAPPGEFTWTSTLFQRIGWAIDGFKLILAGAPLPMSPGEWYWLPSRVVPPWGGNEITEFPLFTFIYSDLHAHMIAMQIMLLAVSWALSVVAGRGMLGWWNQASGRVDAWRVGVGILVGALIIGALYPTNLSDMYTFLPIGLAAVAYAFWRYSAEMELSKRLAWTIGSLVALTMLSFVMYQPYRAWYLQAYSSLDPWTGPFTPLASYFTMWGLLLFVIVSWMAWETREWMAETPLSALQKLRPYRALIEGALIVFGLVLLVIQFRQSSTDWGGLAVAWLALPLAVWAGVLLLRPNMTDEKRFVLFLVGTALMITVVVELVVVRGDIGRQNTIFKFYLQAWFLLAASAAAALAWVVPAFFRWLPGWRAFWQGSMILLVSVASLFPVTAISGKVKDRWILEAPRSLDSMNYMQYANYDTNGVRLNLREDYNAIRWLQDNVQGSPVIVETNCPEYRWCTRMTIYTGLPGVVGWNWHQRQQRGANSLLVEARVAEVGNFYNGVDAEAARDFLKTYDVQYIIVGQLERATYTVEGLAKFDQYEGTYWREVYRDGQTVIYEVLP